jgi:DNA-binding PadR family transcriptional regulator
MFDDEKQHPPLFGHRNWLRHTAMVPKGFIRYHVLEALNEKPMSGSEIMEQIQKQTGSCWKPSPGSIYPLLAWLQDNGYVKEMPSENGMKRYELTQNGKELLEEQKLIRNKFREEAGFMPGQFFGSFLMKIPPEKLHDMRATMGDFAKAMFGVGNSLRENYSEQSLNDALRVIAETSKKLDDITQKLKGRKT